MRVSLASNALTSSSEVAAAICWRIVATSFACVEARCNDEGGAAGGFEGGLGAAFTFSAALGFSVLGLAVCELSGSTDGYLLGCASTEDERFGTHIFFLFGRGVDLRSAAAVSSAAGC